MSCVRFLDNSNFTDFIEIYNDYIINRFNFDDSMTNCLAFLTDIKYLDRFIIFLLYRGDKLIGFVSGYSKSASEFFIQDLYVNSFSRHLKELINHIILYAIEQGSTVARFTLFTDKIKSLICDKSIKLVNDNGDSKDYIIDLGDIYGSG